MSFATGVTFGGTTGFSSEIETGGWTGAVGFAPDEPGVPLEPGAVVPVGAPLDELEPGALDCVPDEQPASTTARATAATAFLMRTILANRDTRSL
ncbi:hypothetical protein GCM10017774_66630 [Lentzea cavernae]|uniref:Uncharacterized protein n=1 Tax=Lentzea cavernae TaxID=2020703 RepID=A0ABQ3MPY5_9PSEU|nr:hypothetical protein GCM10017774_66630 [Lentzea cavernae]